MLTENGKAEDTRIPKEGVEGSLKDTGFCITGIRGISMIPMLNEKTDHVIIGRTEEGLKTGDVALYRRGSDLVLHRVIGLLPEGYLIRGDNCIGTENVRREAVLGKLCGIQRNGDCIEVTDEMNDAFFKRSCRTLPARKWKARLLGFLRGIRKHAGLAQK